MSTLVGSGDLFGFLRGIEIFFVLPFVALPLSFKFL